ncbi:hypothetical protein [Streptomyces shaanxiensis]
MSRQMLGSTSSRSRSPVHTSGKVSRIVRSGGQKTSVLSAEASHQPATSSAGRASTKRS